MRLLLFLLLSLSISPAAFSQTATCPDNIDFSSGSFDQWACYTGTRANSANAVFTLSGPVNGRHTLIPNNSTVLDKYGKFPVHSPNAAGYTARVGNDRDGAEADRISYSFSISPGISSYSIVYQYAMVAGFQQDEVPLMSPYFTVGVFNVTDNEYIDCVANKVIPEPSTPGMKKSAEGINIYYQDWTAVSIDLSGYAGKQLRLEFSTADCFFPDRSNLPDVNLGHFGYAYVDVTGQCGSLISGNKVCDPSSVVLKGPGGYREYAWYDGSLTHIIGQDSVLEIKPAPPVNTVYALKLTPFPGRGCDDILYTSIQPGAPISSYALKDTLYACSAISADLTDPSLTSGSEPGLTFSYFTDAECLQPIGNAKDIRSEGRYYVKAENSSNCFLVKAITVVFYPARLVITDPPTVYIPFSVNLTDPSITRGSSDGFSYSFWRDPAATIPLSSPGSVTKGGTYYLKAVNGGCVSVAPIHVSIKVAIPDTFTPNGDGINDLFRIAGQNDNVSLTIYNRWGDRVFTSKKTVNAWDGTNNGIRQPAGSYYWILRSADLKLLLKGSITLIR